MLFQETNLSGAFLIELRHLTDDRGFFARTWCRDEFEKLGLETEFVQCNLSYTRSRGTIRGLHYQIAPHREAKLIRCLTGAIYDVIVDLRPESPTYRKWLSVELTGDNYHMLYVPQGFAHGFQTLRDDSEVHYQVSHFYCPEAERGCRWNDPTFRIDWPLPVQKLSEKDAGWPDYRVAS